MALSLTVLASASLPLPRGSETSAPPFNEYGEASLDVHELLELAVDSATSRDWRYIGARSHSEARGYYTASM